MCENLSKVQFISVVKKRFSVTPAMWRFMLEYSTFDLPINRKIEEHDKLRTCHRWNMERAWRMPKSGLIGKTISIA